jgi:hypothetical protein
MSAVELYLGIGLLKLKVLSSTLAGYFFLFDIVNSSLFDPDVRRTPTMAAVNAVPLADTIFCAGFR